MKQCRICKKFKPKSEFYPCKKSRDKLQYECRVCALKIKAKHRRECKEKGIMNYSQRTRQRLRLEVLQHYSAEEPLCDCCGETHIEFLSVDHVKGGGQKHRKVIGQSGLYSWLKKNSFPPGFRVLCHNCNQSIGLYGYCPHQKPDARPFCPPKI